MERMRNMWVLAGAFVAVAAIIAVSWRMSIIWFDQPRSHEAFGDLFAFADVVILGVTLAFLVVGFVAQEKYTRQQTRHMAEQDFENSFYTKVSLWTELANNIQFRITNETTWSFKGREVFTHLEPKIRHRMHGVDLEETEFVKRAYVEFEKETKFVLQGYFSVLSHIVRDVVRSEILSVDEKRRAMKFLRAQLTQHEMIHLFYRCMSVPDGTIAGSARTAGLLRYLNIDLINESHRPFLKQFQNSPNPTWVA